MKLRGVDCQWSSDEGSAVLRLVTSSLVSFLLVTMFAPDAAQSQDKFEYGSENMPIAFTKNVGQWDGRVLFKANCRGMIVWLTTEGTFYQLVRAKNFGSNDKLSRQKRRFTNGPESERDTIEQISIMKTNVGSNLSARVDAMGELTFKSNFFIGNDPEKWRTNVPSYSSVVLHEVYPQIDLKYYSTSEGNLEYDFVVRPGADYRQIKIKYEGASLLTIGQSSDLRIDTKWNFLTEQAPKIYQEVKGKRRQVSGSFRLLDESTVSFELGDDYDATLPITIDPTIVYSTFLGGSAYECGANIAVDREGSAYVVGVTYSTDFPSADSTHSGPMWTDVFVSKLAPDGSSLEYSTLIGGSDEDECYSVAVDDFGCAYGCGWTFSPDFPLQNSYQSELKFFDGVFFKLNATGDTLIFSSYFGGSGVDEFQDIVVNDSGQAYLIGLTSSSNIPLLNPYQSAISSSNTGEAYIVKFSMTGNELLYGTYFGGSDWEWGGLIAVDAQGQIVVAGATESTDFPTKNPIQAYTRVMDSYVAKFGENGDTLIYSTFIGGFNGDDKTFGLAVDSLGCAYIGGTTSSADFPVKNPFQPKYVGEDAFVTKISVNGDSIVYSTPIGGTGGDQGFDLALVGERAIITGWTMSTDFPIKDPYQTNGSPKVFVTELSPTGSSLEFSTLLGGIRNSWEQAYAVASDHNSNVYITGHTTSIDFPVLGPIQDYAGEYDVFVTKLKPEFQCGDIDASDEIVLSDIVYFVNYIFANGPQPNPIVAADIDCSGQVTVSDVVYLITYIFSGGPAPCASCP